MENPSSPRLGKLTSSGLPKVRSVKHGHLQDAGSLPCPENNKNSPESDDPADGKRKGRPKTEVQELRSIPAIMLEQWKEEFKRRSRVKCPCSGCWLEFPSIYGVKYHYQRCQGATVGEKLSHGCPYCEATFATKVRLEKHKLWNHPERVSLDAKDEQNKFPKKAIKSNNKKRPLEHSPPSPVFFKVKKIHETFTPFHNGELLHHKSERKLPSIKEPSPHVHQSVQSQSQQSHSASSDAGGSESEGGSLPPLYSDEDPERMKHRRKQKTPKKFTGEQPSISGTFGLKGMTKVEEKLKAGRLKKAESNYNETPQRRPAPNQPSKKDQAATSSSGSVTDTLWQKAISERGEVVCPTCSIVTRKTIQGLKNHMEICQKLQDALKCQQCHKQFRSKAGLNYHIMAEHSTKPSGSESQVADEHDERERLRRTLKQMGRIKCPSEHSGKNHCTKPGRDFHAHTENSAAISSTLAVNSKDHVTDTNNNTGKDKVSEVVAAAGRKDHERREWHDQTRQVKDRDSRAEKPEKDRSESAREKPVQNAGFQEDFERTPSGRVRRRSAQVAVFHLQEIAEDELAKDWGTKRRNKDDLVPDSKRLNYTRPGLPNFSPELIETWKNQVKERGFICCINENCEAVYSSVSGLKAHLANCSLRGGELGKYTCLICQKAFNSESGVKYHISKTHSQNWFRAAASEVVSSSKPKSLEDNGIEPEVRNGATAGKKRGRKPKERRPVVEALHTLTEESVSSQNSSPAMSRSSSPTQMLTDEENSGLSNPLLDRRNKSKKLLLSE